MRSRTLVGVWALVVTTAMAFTALRFLNLFGHDSLDFVALTSLSVTSATLGTLILRRHAGHRVGILFLALGSNISVVLAMREIATELDPASAVAGTIALVEELFRIWGLGLALVLLLVFPTGRLLSRRWVWAVALLGTVMTLGWISGQLLVPGVIDGLPPVHNPFATAATGRIARAMEPLGVLAVPAILAVLASIVLRYRRAATLEREQLKYFALSVVGVIVLIFGLTIAFPKQVENGILGSLIWQTPGILPPAAAAHAILRRGLFDINRVVSRTLSYAVVTVLLGGTFALVVVVPTLVVGTGEAPDYLIAIATLIVFGLFRPVRRRVQDTVDHRFNRARYDAEHTIETFALRLREQIDIDALRSELRSVVGSTMQPEHVSLWLIGTGGR